MTKSKKLDTGLIKKIEEKSVGLCFRCEWRARYFETGSGPRMECGTTTRSSYSCYMYTPVRPVVLVANEGDKRFPLTLWMLSARCHADGLANVFLAADIIKGNKKKNKYLKYWLPIDEAKPKKRGK